MYLPYGFVRQSCPSSSFWMRFICVLRFSKSSLFRLKLARPPWSPSSSSPVAKLVLFCCSPLFLSKARALVSALVKDAVPAGWKAGLVQADMGVAAWIDDLAKRLEHLASTSKAGPKTGPDAAPFWLGGLFSPDAFVTASRQHVAGALSCSLDELGLSLVVGAQGGSSTEQGK